MNYTLNHGDHGDHGGKALWSFVAAFSSSRFTHRFFSVVSVVSVVQGLDEETK